MNSVSVYKILRPIPLNIAYAIIVDYVSAYETGIVMNDLYFDRTMSYGHDGSL